MFLEKVDKLFWERLSRSMAENEKSFERVIVLDDIDPRDLSGVGNSNILRLEALNPMLSITMRGQKLRVKGENEQLELFCQNFDQLIAYYKRYGHISEVVINQVFGLSSNIAKKKDIELDDKNIILFGSNGNVIRAITENQRVMVDLFTKNDLLFATGPAGSGKTYTTIALAVKALKNRTVKRIILTRPAVEAGEKLGFLPGDMKEKLDPYLQPLYDALHDMLPAKKLATYMEEGVVQIAPLAYMRGRTLDNAIVILDEAQNCTVSQLKMFLTRMGRNSKFIVTGDASQVDLEKKSESGLLKTISILKNVGNIASIEMKSSDIVRHQLVKDIVAAYATLDKKMS